MPIMCGVNWANARDFQRKRVYKFDDEIIKLVAIAGSKYGLLSEEATIELIVSIFKHYNIPYLPTIEFKPESTIRATGTLYRICLPEWARHKLVIIHELAHAIAQYKVKNGEYAPHGPEFVSIYMRIVSDYLGIDLKVLTTMATEMRIKYKEEYMNV
jgi:hypothetical protein